MVEFYGHNLDLRFDYYGRYSRHCDVALCCTHDELSELVDTCLDELEQHWSNPRSSNLESWAVDLMKAIIKAAGRGSMDTLGKYDYVFALYLDSDTLEELKSQDDEDEEDEED